MFHEDKTPSLSIVKFPDGNWRMKCFGCGEAGDPVHYLQKQQGMSFIEAVEYLTREANLAPMATQARVVKEYDYYHGTSGELLYQVQRLEPKGFRCRRPDPSGNWVWDMCGVQRVLYRLPRLIGLAPGSTVYYCEGEKDVETLERHGLVATTHAGGVGSYKPDLIDPIKHLRLVVVPDNDEPGKQLMRRVWADARQRKMQVGFLLLPDQYKDSTEYFQGGHSAEEFTALVK